MSPTFAAHVAAPCSVIDDCAVARSIADRWQDIVRGIRDEYLDHTHRFPWVIGFSGGKDSTVVAHGVFEALLSVPPSQRTREVHVVSNDTMVESPVVIAHLDVVTKRIKEAAENLDLPITVARTQPDPDKTFWVLLIGKGYPSPNLTMRWCTDRLKIQPTSGYIKRNISQYGAAIVVLGVRRDESQSRQRSIDKRMNDRGTNLTPHGDLTGAFIYRPIVDLTTDDVWEILGSYHAPWGGNHQDLFQLYRDAEGGECPVVLSQTEAPGCGTKSSRFGCWTCTVVEKDKSLQGFIDSGSHHFKPLVEFRDWLKSIRNNPEMRQAYRRNGRLAFDATGKHIPGPFTVQARKLILDNLLRVQEEFGGQLITEAELDLIYQYWTTDLQNEKGLSDE
ncbi:DNA phosphorothioation system sulfurtransferase DndC [Betaproteobacteria bacterium SCN1]|nr:DNA phosphorothioation system sulfurtransferase DndC [Betaproteobacteria bacterium SCN1]